MKNDTEINTSFNANEYSTTAPLLFLITQYVRTAWIMMHELEIQIETSYTFSFSGVPSVLIL